MLGQRLDGITMAYAVAHLGKISAWTAGEILLGFYLSEVCGLAPAQMALVLASSLVASAVADLVVAQVLRHRLEDVDGAARLQMLGALISASALMALFVGSWLPPAWRLGHGLVFAALFRIGYVVLDLPQNVLMSTATRDTASRARLTALRLAMSSAGALLVSLALVPLMSPHIGLPVAGRFAILAVLLSLLALGGAFALMTALVAGPRVPAARLARSPQPWPAAGLWRTIGLICLVATALACFTKVAPYYAAYGATGTAWGAWVLPALALGAALSQAAWGWLALRGHDVLGPASLLFGSGAAVFWYGQAQPALALVAAFFVGAGGSGLGGALWAAFAGRVAVGRGGAALAYASLTASMKLALAGGAGAIGAVLAGIDYRGAEAGMLASLMVVPAIATGLALLPLARRGRRRYCS